jgi:hypothetical protein
MKLLIMKFSPLPCYLAHCVDRIQNCLVLKLVVHILTIELSRINLPLVAFYYGRLVSAGVFGNWGNRNGWIWHYSDVDSNWKLGGW